MRFMKVNNSKTGDVHLINLDNVAEVVVGKASLTFDYVGGTKRVMVGTALGDDFIPLTEIFKNLKTWEADEDPT